MTDFTFSDVNQMRGVRLVVYGATRVDSRRVLSSWMMGGKIRMRIVFDGCEREELGF